MNLRITDAPIDSADKVVVVFTGVTVQAEDGQRVEYEYEEPREIDLLSLQGQTTESLLEEVELEAGDYEWIRLHVAAETGVTDSYIEVDGAQHDLRIPSGAQTGLKLVNGFTIEEDQTSNYTIDFDLRQSIVHNPQGYKLKPTLRLVADDDTGTVDGSVDGGLITAECSGAIYVYAGVDITPGDLGGEEVQPLTTKLVDTDATGVTEFEYELAFMAAGEYTLAFTCEADLDDPEADDTLEWLATHSVTVTAGGSATVDF
ncbi:DUF4382 domain-containing protein [Saccharospirillum salsuginis]|nr:DUF4382 domain-containing protein [Saccharospirillum salsuginis]